MYGLLMACIPVRLLNVAVPFKSKNAEAKILDRLVVINYLGLVARKPVFGGLRTTKAQTSLRIRAV